MKYRFTVLRRLLEGALSALPSRLGSGDRLILAYHNVVPRDQSGRGDSSLHLPIDAFARQLDILKREAAIVPLVNLIRNPNPRDFEVAITFDDAYEGTLRLGVRACLSAGVPCTVFVSPGLLNRFAPWDVRSEQGRWREADRNAFLQEEKGLECDLQSVAHTLPPTYRIADLTLLHETAKHELVTLGNHTQDHANLGALDASEATSQIKGGRDWLRERFPDAEFSVLAYPYGIPPRVEVNREYYQYGLLVGGGAIRRGQPVLTQRLPRWNVPAGISDKGFQLRVRGRWMT